VQYGKLNDPHGDEVFFDAIKAGLPPGIKVVEVDTYAEDPKFVKECVDRLIDLIEVGEVGS
jgi:hypothetical protein